MNDWIIPIALVLAWLTIAGSTWHQMRRSEARIARASGYAQGFEDGERYQIQQMLVKDDAYKQAYTLGWCACLEMLDVQTPGWRDRI